LVQSDDQATPSADSPAEQKPADGKDEKTEKDKDKDKVESDALTPAPDKQLTALHARFIKDAEKLANQYLKSKQPDRAVAVYKEILKIVPDEPGARQQLEKLRQYEAVADRKTFKVQAKGDWQDTGVRVLAGKPLKLAATGSWICGMSVETGPNGIEMPKALKDLRLGALVGMIDDPSATETKVFAIGAEKDLTSQQSGALLVRMHCIDPSENQGSLLLDITGRFETESK
jgi:hypothetical protein